MDTALLSVNERFEQLNEYFEFWSFLYNIKQIPEKPELVKLCSDLQLKLTVDSTSDIDGCMLCDELTSLLSFLPDENVTPICVLNFTKDNNFQCSGRNKDSSMPPTSVCNQIALSNYY